MKKIIALTSLYLVAFQFTACKTEVKKEEIKPTVIESVAPFSLKTSENTINFTAYKTTEKVPVKGIFKKVEITKGGEGNSIKEAINGTEFNIPVSGIETNDSTRNFKIQKFFFSVMENSLTLSGKLNLEESADKGFAEFTMNGITQKLPFEYTIDGKTFTMNTTMDVEKWNGQSAIASLNEACKDLHKGTDGVSKTWSEVAITIVSTFK
ncbi:YceI-like domain-containing protein [Tenacibaculum adriaticum]|uniref:YceI-like domain-containing protein n=1 Tax=Tenacibaculum adriaticum TaxID=413713 RepID=A0A5S5DKJ6_9FLAO|nr:YceI family protein [Tenacibaculum adriaticum]TYP96451.1 YceI-like domain-containing protein [Tenacibaculum adriaticum]